MSEWEKSLYKSCLYYEIKIGSFSIGLRYEKESYTYNLFSIEKEVITGYKIVGILYDVKLNAKTDIEAKKEALEKAFIYFVSIAGEFQKAINEVTE